MTVAYEIAWDAEGNYVFDFTDWLGDGETITGYSEEGDSGLVFEDPGSEISAGQRQVHVGPHLETQVGSSFDLKCTATTNSTPAQVEPRVMTFTIVQKR